MRVTVALNEIARDQTALAGGKAANLGELFRVHDIAVPQGICITTQAFDAVVANDAKIAEAIDRLRDANAGEAGADGQLCSHIRLLFRQTELPFGLEHSLALMLADAGAETKWAVRSSATAEDMPEASFAGQHDSQLNVSGLGGVIDAIRDCWASLFTQRAFKYRQRNGLNEADVKMAVIVQRMVPAEASGVMFTADPVSGDRTIVAIEAVAGTGEALASGAVVPQSIKFRTDEIIEIGEPAQRVLHEKEARVLAVIGRRIEAHLGSPQDIEWCLADGVFQIVQSRPITTLFPVPVRTDGRKHVYLSVGHQQMMTDAMTPLGLSIWQMLAARPMFEAGGRMFVDITDQLLSPSSRKALMQGLGRDPLISSVIRMLLARNFLGLRPDAEPEAAAARQDSAEPTEEHDPGVVAELIESSRRATEVAAQALSSLSGSALFDFLENDIAALKQQLRDPKSTKALMAGINASWWLNDHLSQWLGEAGMTDALSQSVDHNITSQMGLDLLDLADAIRPHAAAIATMREMGMDASLDLLLSVAGGPEALAAINRYLSKYGMRCAGEIDMGRTRWREQPGLLIPIILGNIERFEPGEAKRRFDAGLARARAAEENVLTRLRSLPDGRAKVEETKKAIDRLRSFIGYREYPKYGWVCRLDLYKQAMLREAQGLAGKGAINTPDDIFFLRFDELLDVVRTQEADMALVHSRRVEFEAFKKLNSPRVLTSDGEALFGSYERGDLPPNAIPGLAVSAGCVEGRARVLKDLIAARLEPGDILVTRYTDPS